MGSERDEKMSQMLKCRKPLQLASSRKLMTNQTYGILQAVGTFAGIGVIGYWSKQMFVNGDLAPFEENTLGGKTILITGASSGFGRFVAGECARRGARVIMASRSLNNLKLARDELLNQYPEAELLITQVDLAQLDSVEELSYKVLKNFNGVDILICNAGIFRPRGTRDAPETKDGMERQFQVNFLGHFLLAELLREKIEERRGKVINVMCRSMQKAVLTLSVSDKKSSFKDITQHETQIPKYNAEIRGDDTDIRNYDSADVDEFTKVEAYMQSKLCLLLYTRHLARISPAATVVGVDPGASTETLFNRHQSTSYTAKSTLLYPIQLFWRLFERSVGNNAQTIVAACDPVKFAGAEYSGKILSDQSIAFYEKQFASG